MAIFIKLIRVILIIAACLAAVIYGGVYLGHKVIFPIKTSNVPTIQPVTDGKFTFGAQAHLTQPKTIGEYITVLAGQLKRYNEAAPELWPDNALVNQSVIVEGIKSKKFWRIAPNGTVTPLSKKEALSYGFRRSAYTGGFSPFDGGMYLAVTEENLSNYLMWQQYLHLGTYDSILFLTHEGFHAKEQTEAKWRTMSEIHNRARNEFLENTPARAKRALLQKQLLEAVSKPGDTQLILDALATYAEWKAQFPDEYQNALYFDRIEGPANYFELITGLYSGYPDQVKDSDDLSLALALLATRDDIYVRYGLVNECYTIGGFSCVLLDRLESGWKEELMNNPESTPTELLFRHFKDETLPAPRQLTQSEINAAAEEINKPAENRGMPLLFKLLYDILF
jgi:hypothetical protein